MSVAPYTEWFTIYTFQEDETCTATVQALCEYMQEAAGNHAALLGVSIERLHDEGVAWVLARMRVAPVALPRVHERIQVETWPVGIEGLQFRRDFIVRREDGSWLFDGLIPIPELKDRLELSGVPDEAKGQYNTLGGMMMWLCGHIPRTGEKMRWENWELEVVDLDGNRVDKVLASRLPDAVPEGEPPPGDS